MSAYAFARSSGTSRSERSDRPVRLKDKAWPAAMLAGAMNQTVRPPLQPIRIGHSACPHDCPSTCALEVEVLDDRTIGRVRGAQDNAYTAGVICAKVARYAERIHHPDRLTQPLRRTGPKGSGQFEPISWDDALDLVAEKFLAAEARYGARRSGPTTTPAPWAWCMRDGINRLRHAKKYSGFHSTICVNSGLHRLRRRHRHASPAPIRARWRSPIWS